MIKFSINRITNLLVICPVFKMIFSSLRVYTHLFNFLLLVYSGRLVITETYFEGSRRGLWSHHGVSTHPPIILNSFSLGLEKFTYEIDNLWVREVLQ